MENYTSKEDGQPVYVRIRMSEYLETGNDAGEKTDDPARDAASLLPGADINDTSTWSIHTPGADSLEECDTVPSFHDYWTWELGGSTTYMPTFNKNNQSLEADINGTWESVGPAGNRYSDYKSYTDGEEKTDDAQYAPNSSVGTEVTDDQGNVLYKEQNETHTAKPTQDAKVIRMQDWLDGGAIPGKFWVWDTDGWVYWAEALQPEEATGCLLTGISPTSDVSSNMYYAIDVVGGAASAFDWGNKGTGTNGTGDGATGFYEKGVTDNGKYLLDRIASVVTNADGDRYVDCGNNTYKKIEGEDSLGDLICAGKDKKPGTEDDKTNIIQLDTALSIDGTDYGTLFIGPDKNNTYWAMGKDKLFGTSDDVKIWYKGSGAFPGNPVNSDDFSFKGADDITVTNLTDGMEVEPGQSITGITTQVTLNGTPISNQDVTWTISGSGKQKAGRLAGTKFDASSKTLSIDPEEKAGTQLTVTIESDEDAKNASKTLTLKVVGPDEVSITSGGTEVTTEQTLKQGGSQTFVATVKRKGNTYTNNQVTWELTGNTKVGTTLVDGVLTVDGEEPVGTILAITAKSVDDTTVSASITVRVKKCVILGGETTVDIDGITWYIR